MCTNNIGLTFLKLILSYLGNPPSFPSSVPMYSYFTKVLASSHSVSLSHTINEKEWFTNSTNLKGNKTLFVMIKTVQSRR